MTTTKLFLSDSETNKFSCFFTYDRSTTNFVVIKMMRKKQLYINMLHNVLIMSSHHFIDTFFPMRSGYQEDWNTGYAEILWSFSTCYKSSV